MGAEMGRETSVSDRLQRCLTELSQTLREQGEPEAMMRAREALSATLGCTVWDWLKHPKDFERRFAEAGNDWDSHIDTWTNQRRTGRPWAQILGGSWFWGRWFSLSSSVLIPRSDSEVLVEAALESAERLATQRERTVQQDDADSSGLRVAEVCTGSGALLLTWALEAQQRGLPVEALCGTDSSSEALSCARDNAKRLAPGLNIQWREGDFLSALANFGPIDLLFLNPPYVSLEEWQGLAEQVRSFEPRMALTDEGDGLAFYRRLLTERWPLLRSGAEVWMEIGYRQAEAVCALGREAGVRCLGVRQDYAGLDRVVGFTGVYNLEV